MVISLLLRFYRFGGPVGAWRRDHLIRIILKLLKKASGYIAMGIVAMGIEMVRGYRAKLPTFQSVLTERPYPGFGPNF